MYTPGTTITSTGTAVASPIPLDAQGGFPTTIRLSASAPAYVRLTNDGTAAVAGDMLVQPGDDIVLWAASFKSISVLSVSGTASVYVHPDDVGQWSGINPTSLDLNFRASTTLDSRITFTRADAVTCATYFDSTGRMATMGRNILTYSSTFTNAAWSKTDVTPTLGESSPLDVGYLMTEGSAGTALLYQNAAAVTAGSTITVSVVLKRGNTDWVRLSVSEISGTDGARGWFNLNTGAKGSTAAVGAGSAITSTIASLGGGWYRCTVTVLPNGTYTLPTVYVASASADSSNTRVSGATYTVSAAQLELGSTATTYSATTTAANSGPRFDYDPASPAGVTGGELATTATTPLLGAGTAANTPNLSVSVTVGKTYLVSYTLSQSAGACAGILGGTSSGFATHIGAVSGSFTAYVRALTTSALAFFSNNAVGSVTNISVQEVTFNPRGLLIEESRQNLLLQSRDMTQAAWTKTDVTPARTQVGIDGVANTACLMTEGSAGTAVTLQNGASVTAGSTITGSVVVKRGNTDWVRLRVSETGGADGCDAWFNLNTGAKGATAVVGVGSSITSTITSLGGGWYRCVATCIPNGTYTVPRIALRSAAADSSTAVVANATYIVDCAQLEVGAFATSIIPTTTTALTRAADSASMTGANFSSWYNQTAGTYVAEYVVPQTGTRGVISANDGTLSNKFDVRAGGSYSVGAVGGVTQWAFNGTTPAAFVVNKYALAYAVNDIAGTLNGGAMQTDAVASLPTVTQLQIGGLDGSTSAQLNGHIRSLRYYPTRLANATLQALTA